MMESLLTARVRFRDTLLRAGGWGGGPQSSPRAPALPRARAGQLPGVSVHSRINNRGSARLTPECKLPHVPRLERFP